MLRPSSKSPIIMKDKKKEDEEQQRDTFSYVGHDEIVFVQVRRGLLALSSLTKMLCQVSQIVFSKEEKKLSMATRCTTRYSDAF